MSYHKLLLFAISIFFFASCSQEDISEKAVGTWQVEAYRITCSNPSPELEFPWTDVLPDECLATPELELFWCLTGLEITADQKSVITGLNNGNTFSNNSSFTNFADDKVYFCPNEGDILEECDFVFFDGDKLIYQLFDLGTLNDEGCLEQYRMKKM